MPVEPVEEGRIAGRHRRQQRLESLVDRRRLHDEAAAEDSCGVGANLGPDPHEERLISYKRHAGRQVLRAGEFRDDLEQPVDPIRAAMQDRSRDTGARRMAGEDEPLTRDDRLENVEDDVEDLVIGGDPRVALRQPPTRQVEVEPAPTRPIDEQRLEVVGGYLPGVGPAGQDDEGSAHAKRLVVDRDSVKPTLHGGRLYRGNPETRGQI